MENLKGLPKSKWKDAAFEKVLSGLGTTAFRLVGLVNEKQLQSDYGQCQESTEDSSASVVTFFGHGS